MEAIGAEGDMENRDGEIEIGNTSAQAHMKVVLGFWKDFNLDGRRLQLDKQGLELQDAKDASLLRRKKLAELTKEFRKKSDVDKVSGVQRLVKAYQEEIDCLAKRCRASDTAFFSLYKALYEAPDPAQALERSASERPRAAASELEVQKLQAELSEYEEEFSKLKNQDITIRRLEDIIAGYEDGAEAQAEAEAATRVKALEEAAEGRAEAARESEAQMAKSLEAAEGLLAEAREKADTMEGRLFETSRGAQEAEAAWEAEREILSQTNESSQAQLARLEQELYDLRRQDHSGGMTVAGTQGAIGGASYSGAASKTGTGNAAASTTEQLSGTGLSHAEAIETELAELTRVNSQLRGEMVARSSAWREEKEALDGALRSAKDSLAAETSAVASLRKELGERPTVAENRSLRQQLRVLQQLEFNAADDDDDQDGGRKDMVGTGRDEPQSADPEDTASHVERTMEQVIRSRVRRLEADLTSSRRLAEERGVDIGRLQRSLDAATLLASDRLEAINRLEDDLATAFRSGGKKAGMDASPRKGGATGGNEFGTAGSGGNRGIGNANSPSTNALRELLGVTEDGGVGARDGDAGMGVGGEVGDVDHGVLGIVQAQRDRFRRRIKELEAEREDEQREARGAQSVLERLQKDNLQLYEKVRFLQSYQRGASNNLGDKSGLLSEDVETGRGAAVPGRGQGTQRGSSPTEARYGQMYEARINPFAQFSQREKQRKYEELSVAEKITLSTTRMFLGNKFARNFVFFYVLFLHLVVCVTVNYKTHAFRANYEDRR